MPRASAAATATGWGRTVMTQAGPVSGGLSRGGSCTRLPSRSTETAMTPPWSRARTSSRPSSPAISKVPVNCSEARRRSSRGASTKALLSEARRGAPAGSGTQRAAPGRAGAAAGGAAGVGAAATGSGVAAGAGTGSAAGSAAGAASATATPPSTSSISASGRPASAIRRRSSAAPAAVSIPLALPSRARLTRARPGSISRTTAGTWSSPASRAAATTRWAATGS